MEELDELKATILGLVDEYSRVEAAAKKGRQYRPGDAIPYASRNYDEHERRNLVESALTFWLTAGEYARRFEEGLAAYLGVSFAYAVNSGSAANQLAFSALTSPQLGDRALKRGGGGGGGPG
jgi:CDP-6-deoxy-D-xylo-4-hexulose-3-dehydrase